MASSTVPTKLSAIPTSLDPEEADWLLEAPLSELLATRGLPEDIRRALKTVASILRARCVGDLCTDEAESLFVNRFSPGIATSVRDCLWVWLQSLDSDDDVDEDLDPSTKILLALHDQDARPPSPKRDGPPSIEAPPSSTPALERWCERFGVSDRLADSMRLGSAGSYGLDVVASGWTIRDAALATVDAISGPKYYRRQVVSQLVPAAKAYLHRAAQAVAMAAHRHEARQARAHRPDDPFVLRFLDLVKSSREKLASPSQPRPLGTFLPGRVYLHANAPELHYSEWDIHRGQMLTVESQPFFTVRLAGWEQGSLEFQCQRCRDLSSCPHAATALDEVVAELHDPTDSLAPALAPVLRVPGWSRLIAHLDAQVAKPEPVAGESQRLIWEILRESDSLSLLPVIQKQGKRGWSKGNRLSLDSLEYGPHFLQDATDQAVFEALMGARDRTSYYSPRLQNPRQVWRGLAALAGSTRVFMAPDRTTPISVRKVRPALRVEAGNGGFHLRAALGPNDVDAAAVLAIAKDGRHVVWLDSEHGRCLLAMLDPDTKALLSAMASFPVALPAEGIAELLVRLPRMQTTIDVHLPEELRGERVEPASMMLCRLEPLPEEGLRVDLLVRPIPGGPVFAPGDGPPELLHMRDGRRVHCVRQLGAERERGAHLAQVAGLDDTSAASAWRWDVTDDAAALDVLARLRNLPELAEVEWPAGEVRVDTIVRKALKVEIRKRRDWFGAEGGVDIDGTLVPLSELLAASRSGRRFVKLGARRFATIEDELRTRLAALDDVVFENQGAIELGLLAAPALADLVEDPRQLDLVPAFRAVLGNLEAARLDTAEVPAGLNATLRHYQVDGFRWLARLAAWGLGACLADDMGLGKTLQALALLLRRAELGSALVIAPTSVVANWAAEAARFAPALDVRVYRGADRAPLREGLGKGTVLVTSYAIAVRDAEPLSAIQFATLIVDEAQSVKNALTQRFRAIRDLQADFRVALTGTPIENHLGELWAIFRLMTPGLFGSWEQFRARFAVPIERHHDRARQAALARVVRPFLLRRTKAEVAPELPPRTEMNQVIELGPLERRLYESARIEVLESLAKSAAAGVGDEAKQRIKILAALTRLRLLCCHPRLVVEDSPAGSSKLAALVDLLTELRDEGHKALVFSQFTSFLDLARPLVEAAGLRTITLDGSTPAAEREKRVAAFQAGQADVFLLSLRAGGTGLNLTAATYVIHLDPWWNPAVEDQATDRAHRIGQERPVTVIRLVARGTIEEAVLSLHEEKRQLAASILDGADGAARLDSDDLIDLIRRSGDAGDEDAIGEESEAELRKTEP